MFDNYDFFERIQKIKEKKSLGWVEIANLIKINYNTFLKIKQKRDLSTISPRVRRKIEAFIIKYQKILSL